MFISGVSGLGKMANFTVIKLTPLGHKNGPHVCSHFFWKGDSFDCLGEIFLRKTLIHGVFLTNFPGCSEWVVFFQKPPEKLRNWGIYTNMLPEPGGKKSRRKYKCQNQKQSSLDRKSPSKMVPRWGSKWKRFPRKGVYASPSEGVCDGTPLWKWKPFFFFLFSSSFLFL